MRKAVEELSRRLGDIRIHTGAQYRFSYNFDATGRKGDCLGVVFPEGLDPLVRIVREAGRVGLPVFMRGAGTGFSGGSVPVGGGLVISTEKMRRVIDFNRGASTVEVEAGIVNKELQDYLYPHGFFYPPDPASLKVSTIGGNIAENAGGPRAYKYGVTRRYVLSLTWITIEGEVIESPLEGEAALLTGAEGTLGVIYSARLDTRPLPEVAVTSVVQAGTGPEAMERATELLSSGFCPTVLEFIDSRTMACVSEYMRASEFNTGDSFLFFEVDGNRDEVNVQQEILESYCRDNGLGIIKAVDESERETLWELRRAISPSLARKGITKVNEDVSLPLGSLADAVSFINDYSSRLDLDCYVFGHCGDGNLHVNIMTDRRKTDEMRRAMVFVRELFEEVVRLGGTLSGEHGIGITKNGYLDILFSRGEIELQSDLKRCFDPEEYLNPGKYFSGIMQAGSNDL
ncbi:MAG: FAD-binding protein [Bacteroidales bacterium]|nr:FAD-binding protein [Candidatus Latescibacterota bacterium]